MHHYRRLRDMREDHELAQKKVAAHLGVDQRIPYPREKAITKTQ